MSNIYNTDIQELKIAHLPTFWRRTVHLALLTCFVKPAATLYALFLNFKTDIEYKQSITSQVCYMEKMLNDAFDPVERRIYITNTERREPLWVYEPEDDKPIFIFEPADNKPRYIYEEEDFTLYNPDFTVHLPEAIEPATPAATTTLVKAVSGKVDYYKLYSKNYNIVFV